MESEVKFSSGILGISFPVKNMLQILHEKFAKENLQWFKVNFISFIYFKSSASSLLIL